MCQVGIPFPTISLLFSQRLQPFPIFIFYVLVCGGGATLAHCQTLKAAITQTTHTEEERKKRKVSFETKAFTHLSHKYDMGHQKKKKNRHTFTSKFYNLYRKKYSNISLFLPHAHHPFHYTKYTTHNKVHVCICVCFHSSFLAFTHHHQQLFVTYFILFFLSFSLFSLFPFLSWPWRVCRQMSIFIIHDCTCLRFTTTAPLFHKPANRRIFQTLGPSNSVDYGEVDDDDDGKW